MAINIHERFLPGTMLVLYGGKGGGEGGEGCCPVPLPLCSIRELKQRRQWQLQRYFYYFAIIPICSTCTLWAKFPGTKLIGMAFKNSPSCTHVLYKTLNFVISRCCFANDRKDVQKRMTQVQSDCFFSSSLLFCGVLAAFIVA